MATSFVAIYRGDTISSARLIAISADPALVTDVVSKILERKDSPEEDPVVSRVDRGRRSALHLIRKELVDVRV